MRNFLVTAVALGVFGCNQPDPLQQALPPLPAVGGAIVTSAGLLTTGNYATERIAGPASQGLVGDYFMRNDKVRVVIQAPGRAIGPCPFGGNPIDFDRLDAPAGDQLGEVSPFLQLGRTIAWDKGEIVRDGSLGGAAVLRFYGHDAKDDYINVLGLGGVAAIVQPEYAADVDLKLRAAVTYILAPGETRLHVIYTFHNPGQKSLDTLWGTLSDSGAVRGIWHPQHGYGEAAISDILGGNGAPPVLYGALAGEGVTYGIVPVFADPAAGGVGLGIAGVVIEIYGVKTLLDAFGEDGRSLHITPNGTDSRELAVVLASDVADATAQSLAVRGLALAPFSGTTAPGARVAVFDPSKPDGQQIVTTATADAAGNFAGALPPGAYEIQAEDDSLQRSARVAATVPGVFAAPIAPSANITYTIRDRAGNAIPGKVSIIGALPGVPSTAFRDTGTFALPFGVVAWIFSRLGDSTRGDEFDHALRVATGRYRVVISRGPEWSRFEQTLDVGAGGAHVDAVLDHVIDTSGYVAADFHQHSNMSPDSNTLPRERAMSYIADGLEMLSSSEHDVLFDYRPTLEALGVADILASTVGVEATPFDYGHFIAFPLAVDASSPNGGALDWGNGGSFAIPPPDLYQRLRAQGAQVVQVNHPRALPSAFSNFQQTFDRAGLRYDFVARTFGGDAALMPVAALTLGIADGAPMFSTDFDTLEVYNGFGARNAGDEWVDDKVELNLRDYMNFLSFGFTPTPTGVSDAHGLYADVGGIPRTLVRVPDDSPAAIASGAVVQGVIDTLRGTTPRDVVASNAPLVRLTVEGAGPGRVVTPSAGKVTVDVTVQTPPWAPIDTIEIFANNTFDLPAPKGMDPAPLLPALCWTTKATPSARCAQALVAPQALTVTSVETVVGVAGSARLEAHVTVQVDAAMLSSRNRGGAAGQDVWLLARASGSVGLYPVVPAMAATVPLSDLVEGASLANRGVPALAFTSPVYVDVDGGGWRAPFAP